MHILTHGYERRLNTPMRNHPLGVYYPLPRHVFAVEVLPALRGREVLETDTYLAGAFGWFT
jgi:hypothetical protein